MWDYVVDVVNYFLPTRTQVVNASLNQLELERLTIERGLRDVQSEMAAAQARIEACIRDGWEPSVADLAIVDSAERRLEGLRAKITDNADLQNQLIARDTSLARGETLDRVASVMPPVSVVGVQARLDRNAAETRQAATIARMEGATGKDSAARLERIRTNAIAAVRAAP